MMSHHDTTVPLSVIDDTDDGSGEIEVSFDWTPSTAPSGMTGPPEDYDPGAGEEFYIVAVSYKIGDKMFPTKIPPEEDEAIIAWLEENWERPDYAAERADHEYEQYRDRQMEERDAN